MREVVMREVTRKGRPVAVSGAKSQGEGVGSGSMYSIALTERMNLSNPRNRGPERGGSGILPDSIPIVTMESRATGRIRG